MLFLQDAFHPVPLGLREWGIIISAEFSLFLIKETHKAPFPRLSSKKKWQTSNNLTCRL